MLSHLVLLLATLGPQDAAAETRPAARQPLAVLYAGEAGSAREKAFTDFLRSRFEKVGTTTPEELFKTKGAGYDVIVADGSVTLKDERLVFKGCTKPDFPADWSRPTVLIASAGRAVEKSSKIGWL